MKETTFLLENFTKIRIDYSIKHSKRIKKKKKKREKELLYLQIIIICVYLIFALYVK